MLLPLILFLAAGAAVYKYGIPGVMSPIAPQTPAQAAASVPLLPTVNTHSLLVGQRYTFTLASNLGTTDQVVAAMHNVGADTDASQVVGPNALSGVNLWTGTFTWSGAANEPVENIPGVQWVELDLLPSGAPSTTVSGWGPEADHHLAIRAALARG